MINKVAYRNISIKLLWPLNFIHDHYYELELNQFTVIEAPRTTKTMG